MKVLVCGDRNWSDKESIRRELIKLPEDALIIHGACRGADRLAGEVAAELGLTVKGYPAQWSVYGRAAGPVRNKQMLDAGPDLVLAFHPNLVKSKGTRHMVTIARRAGVKVVVHGQSALTRAWATMSRDEVVARLKDEMRGADLDNWDAVIADFRRFLDDDVLDAAVRQIRAEQLELGSADADRILWKATIADLGEALDQYESDCEDRREIREYLDA